MSLAYSTILTKVRNNTDTDSASYTDANITIDVNLAIDNLLLMLFGEGAGGSWQLDDYNQTDYPIITTDLVASQRDYAFTSDGSSNLILDIYKVQVKGNDGVYRDLTPVDQQGENASVGFTDGQNGTGTPTQYDVTGNGIFLDPIPSYAKTAGLRVFINRESTYFLSSDTTKKWGYTGLYHEYLVLYPSYQYSRARGLNNQEAFKRDLLELETKIRKHSGSRQRNIKPKMTPMVENNK